MRDYTQIDRHLDKLIQDVYPQPPDPGHTAWALESINAFNEHMKHVRTVLDVGCGEAFCQEFFQEKGMAYLGICLGEDYANAKAKGMNVQERDFNFSGFDDQMFDLVYSRHSLEHSFSPILSLMEWKRITKRYIALVVPSPVFWEYRGLNHYFVLNDPQYANLFEKLNLAVIWSHSKTQNMTTDPNIQPVEIELWYLLERV